MLCIWLPHWPLQERLARRPEWKEQPVVLYIEGGRGGQTVVARSRRAAACGVRPGMPLAQARALLEGATALAQYEKLDPPVHRSALQDLAEWCLRFSPLVGVEEAEAPECLLLDIAGCDHLFGGEQGMAEHIVRAFAGRGLVARVAIADTLGAAWALAHYGEPKSDPDPFFPALPVAALRLPPEIVDRLRQLDVRTIGRLQSLPRETLPSRFGPEVLQRLDQALGLRPELIQTIKPQPPVETTWDFLHPTAERWVLETMLQKLIEEVVAAVKDKNRGVQQLVCRFSGEQRERAELTVRLLEPTVCASRLFELVRLRLDATKLFPDVCRLHLTAEIAVPEVYHCSLFDDMDQIDGHRELAALIERLSSRLGAAALLRPRWAMDPLPEFAVAYTPALSGGRYSFPGGAWERSATRFRRARSARSRRAAVRSQTEFGNEDHHEDTAPFRPAHLASQPVALEVVSVIPDGPPIRFFWRGRMHLIARCWGPERIETGWWRSAHERRDYYRVETAAGLRFWLFRQIADGEWFLHGTFA